MDIEKAGALWYNKKPHNILVRPTGERALFALSRGCPEGRGGSSSGAPPRRAETGEITGLEGVVRSYEVRNRKTAA